MISDRSPSSQRLIDLTRAQPADRTLQNLLGTLSAKYELCSRLPMYEYEASSEGFERCAAAFEHLAAHEKESFNDLLSCLRLHLDETLGEVKARQEPLTPQPTATDRDVAAAG